MNKIALITAYCFSFLFTFYSYSNEYSENYLNWEREEIIELTESWNGLCNRIENVSRVRSGSRYNNRTKNERVWDGAWNSYCQKFYNSDVNNIWNNKTLKNKISILLNYDHDKFVESWEDGCICYKGKAPPDYSVSSDFKKSDSIFDTYYDGERYLTRIKLDNDGKRDFKIYIDAFNSEPPIDNPELKGYILVPIEIHNNKITKSDPFQFNYLKFARFNFNISEEKSSNICKMTVKYDNEFGIENANGYIPTYFYAIVAILQRYEEKIDCNILH